MDYRHIHVEQVGPVIGATVHGVDLNAVASDDIYAEIRQALWHHHVLFLRDQKLAPAAFARLGAALGTPERHEYFDHVPGFPEIQAVESLGEKSPDTDYWHTDVTFRAEPSMVGILRAVELPPRGGDTLWASTGAAYDALPPALQQFLLGLEAEHDLSTFMRRTGFLEKRDQIDRAIELMAKNPPQTHPVVIAHPITGRRSLFVNSVWTTRILGLDLRLSDHLLDMLWDWVRQPEFQLRFHWAPDSIAIWDNFGTQHFAVFDYAPAPRRMQRMTCGATRPRAAPCGAAAPAR
jgi:taurine dioxygenase